MTRQWDDERSNPTAPLNDILDACEKAIRFSEGMDLVDFARDDRTVFAIVRALEIVGEASKRVPATIRDRYPGIPWRAMAGIRDRLIHDYERVDLEVVWKTVKEDLPKLRVDIHQTLADIGHGQSPH